MRTQTRKAGRIDYDAVLLCPICSSPTLIIGSENHIARNIRCDNCDYSAQSGRDKFFNLRADAISQDRSLLIHQKTTYTNPAFREFVIERSYSYLKKLVTQLKPNVVLDIGAGNGSNGDFLASSIGAYYGFEPSDIPCDGYTQMHESVAEIVLMHNDPSLDLPVQDESVDLAMFLASYDHIPNIEDVLRDAWRTLNPGGHLLITMTNYGFWLKTLLNFLTRRTLFRHEGDHFIVHNPRSLQEEVQSFIPEAEITITDADGLYLPNLPRQLQFVYFANWQIAAMNEILKLIIFRVLRQKHRGSGMTLVFEKPYATD